jgi:hypothetical protein
MTMKATDTATTATATAMTDTTLAHPYRESENVIYCAVCERAALLTCPRCARPYCQEHAQIEGCCADCELELARRAWIGNLVLACYGGVAILGVLYLTLSSPMLAVMTGAFALLGGAFVGAAGRRLARVGVGKVWEVVEQAQLTIAPGTVDGESVHARRRLARRHRDDMYTAAYKAGFNRVQGCA